MSFVSLRDGIFKPILGVVAAAFGQPWVAAALFAANAIDSARRAKRNAALAAEASKKQPEISSTSSIMPRQRVYGMRRVGGLIQYWKTYGPENRDLSIIVVLADHSCEDVLDVYFDDKPLYIDWATGWCGANSEFFVSNVQLISEQVPVVSGALTLSQSPKGAVSLSIVDGRSVVRTGGSDSDAFEEVPTPQTVALDYNHEPGSTTVNLAGYNAGKSFPAEKVWVSYQAETGKPLVRVTKYLGSPAQVADTQLIADSGGEWNAFCRNDNQTYIKVQVIWDETKSSAGLPNISAIVKGYNGIYDPRTSTTGYSENSILITRDYLKYLFKVSESEFDDVAINNDSAYNCDETVTVDDGQVKRYTAHAVLPTNKTRGENLKTLLETCAGSISWSGGKFRLLSGKYREPLASQYGITDGDVMGSPSFQPRPGRRDIFNTVRGKFYDARPTNGAKLYTQTDYVAYSSAEYIEEDGEEIPTTIDFDAVVDYRVANRLAKQMMHRSRQAMRFQLPVNLKGLIYQVGDVIPINLTRYGLNGNYELLERRFTFPNTVVLELQETAAQVYDWNYTEVAYLDPAPNTNLASPTDVDMPIVSVWSSSVADDRPATIDRLEDGTLQPYVLIEWPARVVAGEYVDIYWRRLHETLSRKIPGRVGETSTKLIGVSGGDRIHIEAIAVNSLGAKSPTFILQDYQVDPTLPSYLGLLQTLSANLLKNATLDINTAGWSVQAYNVSGVAPAFARDIATPQKHIPGTPSNAFFYWSSSASGTGPGVYVSSAPFSVKGGKTIAAFANLCAYGTDAVVSVHFFDENNVRCGGASGAPVAGTSDDPYNRFNKIENYGFSGVITDIPDNARTGRLAIDAFGNWSSTITNKHVSVFQPFAGILPPDSTDFPPFDPGSQNPVDTELISAGAVTEVFRSPTTTATIFGISQQTPVTVASAAIPAQAYASTVEIVATGRVYLPTRTNGFSVFGQLLRSDTGAVFWSGPVILAPDNGVEAEFPLQVVQDLQLAAGVPVTVSLRLYMTLTSPYVVGGFMSGEARSVAMKLTTIKR